MPGLILPHSAAAMYRAAGTSSMTVTLEGTGSYNNYATSAAIPVTSFTLSASTYVVAILGGTIHPTFVTDADIGGNGLTYQHDIEDTSGTIVLYGTLPAGTYDTITVTHSSSTAIRVSAAVWTVDGGTLNAITATTDASLIQNEDISVSPSVNAGDVLLAVVGTQRGYGDGVEAFTPIACTQIIDDGSVGSIGGNFTGHTFIGSADVASTGTQQIGATLTQATPSVAVLAAATIRAV